MDIGNSILDSFHDKLEELSRNYNEIICNNNWSEKDAPSILYLIKYAPEGIIVDMEKIFSFFLETGKYDILRELKIEKHAQLIDPLCPNWKEMNPEKLVKNWEFVQEIFSNISEDVVEAMQDRFGILLLTNFEHPTFKEIHCLLKKKELFNWYVFFKRNIDKMSFQLNTIWAIERLSSDDCVVRTIRRMDKESDLYHYFFDYSERWELLGDVLNEDYEILYPSDEE